MCKVCDVDSGTIVDEDGILCCNYCGWNPIEQTCFDFMKKQVKDDIQSCETVLARRAFDVV